MRRIACWLGFVAACAGVLGPAGVAGAITGEEWRRLGSSERAAYVTAIVDAWNGLVVVQEALGSKDSGITVFAEIMTCVRDRLIPPAEVHAIVERYTESHPGLRGKDMPDIVFAALAQHCR